MSIAEDMIEGSSCSLCGDYFEDNQDGGKLLTHGYPVACTACHHPDCGYQEAETNTF